MPQTVIRVGPQDDGRRMSLAEFDRAEAQEGYLYELGRGIIVVSDVPKAPHAAQVAAIRIQFTAYYLSHPGQIHLILAGNECKLLIAGAESERHPDLAVYKTRSPKKDVWSTWIPEVVVEVVSPGSEDRDYEEKREEYLQFGVKEYWIVDADKGEVLVLRRTAGAWKERVLRPPDVYRTRLLPGFEFRCEAVFQAAEDESR